MLCSQTGFKIILNINKVKQEQTLLTSAQREKVFARLGTNIRKKLKDYAPNYKTQERQISAQFTF